MSYAPPRGHAYPKSDNHPDFPPAGTGSVTLPNPFHPSIMPSPSTLFPPAGTERDGQACAALLSTALHSRMSHKPQVLRPHGFRVWGIFTAKLPADSHAARAFRKSSFFLHGTKKSISRTFPCIGWLTTNFPGSENIPDTQPWRG